MSMTDTPTRPEPTNTRGRSRAIWLIVGAIVTILGLGGAAAAAWSGLIDRNIEPQQQTYERTVERIEFDVDAGDVRVVRGDDGRVDIERRLQWGTRTPRIDERWDGDTLRITIDCPGGLFNFCSVDHVVQAPAGVTIATSTSAGDIAVEQIDGELGLTSSAGDIEVTGAQGPVSADTDSGDITISGATDALTARTSAGDIDADALTSTVNDVSTRAGDIALRFDAAPDRVLAKTSSGDVTVIVPRGETAAYQVQTDTSSGSQDVTVDQDTSSPRTIEAETSAGDVTVRYP